MPHMLLAIAKLSSEPGWVAVFGVIEGVGTAGLSPAVLAMLVAACPPSQLSSGQSLALASNELAAAAGAFFGPQIYGRYGGGPIFTGSVVLMVACWFVGVGLYRQGEVSHPPTPRHGSDLRCGSWGRSARMFFRERTESSG